MVYFNRDEHDSFLPPSSDEAEQAECPLLARVAGQPVPDAERPAAGSVGRPGGRGGGGGGRAAGGGRAEGGGPAAAGGATPQPAARLPSAAESQAAGETAPARTHAHAQAVGVDLAF